MPHLAPISWLFIWLFIWLCFFSFSIIIWWGFKAFYNAPFLSTPKDKGLSDTWVW
nr:TPA_asm: ATP synthase F0 subunit 8 [Pachydermia laevis]